MSPLEEEETSPLDEDVLELPPLLDDEVDPAPRKAVSVAPLQAANVHRSSEAPRPRRRKLISMDIVRKSQQARPFCQRAAEPRAKSLPRSPAHHSGTPCKRLI
jgi:hypothetical protein